MLDELEAGALEFVSNKFDLDVDGTMIGTMRTLQVEDSQKLGLRNSDGDNDMSDTLSNMWTKSHVHKAADSFPSIC